jgi:hypothetical protein
MSDYSISTPTLAGLPGEFLDYLDRILCVGEVRVRPGAANGAAPTFDAATTSAFNAIASGGALTFNHTAGATATYIEVRVHLSTSTQHVTGINWDNAGTPVALRLLGRFINSGNDAIEIWYLLNPAATGTKQVAITLSATGIGTAAVQSWIGVGGVRNCRAVTGNSTAPSVAYRSWDNLGIVVDAMTVKNASAATAGQTQRYNVTEANGPTRNCGQSAAATGGSVTMSWTVTSGQWTIIAYELRPTDDPSFLMRQEGVPDALAVLVAGTDEIQVGYDARFTGLRVNVLTGATGGRTITLKYWNGSAWTALSGVVDNTTNLTLTGEHAITWTDPGSGWAKTALNSGPSLYHIQITISGAPTIAPILDFCVVGWTIYDQPAGQAYGGSIASNGNNVATVYKSVGEDGVSAFYIWIDDGTTAQYAQIISYESWNAATHAGTAGAGTPLIRKSLTADSTARTIIALVSRDRACLNIYTGDTSGQALGILFGGLNSYLASDAYRCCLIANANAHTTISAMNAVSDTGLNPDAGWLGSIDRTSGGGATIILQRRATGVGASINGGRLLMVRGNNTGTQAAAKLASPNPADGAYHTHPIIIHEGTTSRGLRGDLGANILAIVHDTTVLVDGDTLTLGGASYRVCMHTDTSGGGSAELVARYLAIRSDLGN